MLRDPGKDRPIVVQISRDQRMIVFSKREMRDYLHKKEIQTRQIFNGLVKYFKAKEIRHTLGAGTVYAQGQEVCFEIYIPEDRPHVLMECCCPRGHQKMSEDDDDPMVIVCAGPPLCLLVDDAAVTAACWL